MEHLRNDMEKCFRCSLCKMVPLPVVREPAFTDGCPASRHHHFHGFSCSGKQIMALSLLDGRLQPHRSMADIVFACTACGYGDVACKFIMDAERHRVSMALRERLVDEGLAPDAIRRSMEALARSERKRPRDGPFGGPRAGELGLRRLPSERAPFLLFAGCTAAADPEAARVARRLAKLLVHAGMKVGVLEGGDPCCGLPAYWCGHRDLFTELASRLSSRVEEAGAHTVVAASGSCLGAIRSKYPEYGQTAGFTVVHATEVLARLIDQGLIRLRRPVERTVTYHDPCYLGRQSEPYPAWTGVEKTTLGCMTYTDPPKPIQRGTRGVYDPPRRILRAIPGLRFTEMYRIREYAFCCGAGGGVPVSNPEMGRATALHRLEEARAVGAEILVTACAHCEKHFRETLANQRPLEGAAGEHAPGPAVTDIVDLVYEAAGLEG